MTIDFDKPVQTRDGRKVRILCTDMKSALSSPVVGLTTEETGQEVLRRWEGDGTYGVSDAGIDLVNVPETRVVWVNMSSVVKRHSSRKDADWWGDENREACIRVEYEVGQFDEEPDA